MNVLLFLNEPHFNVYDLIILMLILQSAMFSALLLGRKDRHVSHFLLAGFIASLGLGQFVFLCLYNPYAAGVLHHLLNETGFALLTLVFYAQGVLLNSYIRALTYGHYQWYWRNWIPVAMGLLLALALPWMWNEFLVKIFWRPFVLTSVLGFALSVVWGIRTLAFIQRYGAQLKNHFCSLEHMDFFWLQAFASGFVVIWVLQFLPPFFYLWAPWWLQQLVVHSSAWFSLGMMNFVFFAGLVHARQLHNISEPAADEGAGAAEEGDEALSRLKQRVDDLIRTHSLYERPNLNIERLAQLLSLPARQLSHLINREFHQNYFEFINSYRLDAVKARLQSPDWVEKSVQEIYESAGFSSKSSFFTLFRKQTGMTPSQYREQVRD